MLASDDFYLMLYFVMSSTFKKRLLYFTSIILMSLSADAKSGFILIEGLSKGS
jgi:hypothetical protein